MDEARDVATQVKQRVQLDRSLSLDFRLAKVRPREHRQTQIFGARIECVGATRQVDTEGLIGVEPTRLIDQALRELGIDAPIARLVGVGKGGAFDRL